jgi:hypothetical protein
VGDFLPEAGDKAAADDAPMCRCRRCRAYAKYPDSPGDFCVNDCEGDRGGKCRVCSNVEYLDNGEFVNAMLWLEAPAAASGEKAAAGTAVDLYDRLLREEGGPGFMVDVAVPEALVKALGVRLKVWPAEDRRLDAWDLRDFVKAFDCLLARAGRTAGLLRDIQAGWVEPEDEEGLMSLIGEALK